jgi:hypothetical protein
MATAGGHFHLAGMKDSKGRGRNAVRSPIRDALIGAKQPLSRSAHKLGLHRTMLPLARPFSPVGQSVAAARVSNIATSSVVFIRAHRTNIGDAIGKRYCYPPSMNILLPLLFLGASFTERRGPDLVK